MARLQVTCVTKTANTHEHITHLGGGSAWAKKPRSTVIYDIEHNINSYYTSVNGNTAEVGVVDGANGKYVRTYADGKYNDNLLALPACS